MKLARWLIGISCAVGIVSADSKVFSQPANQVAPHPESQWSTIQTYCFGCHNKDVTAGNLFLDELGAESVPEHPEIFEKVVRKLRGRQMPPPGMPQPSQQEVDALIGWLESTLDESSKAHLAGRVPVQRLNRTEYANAVKDLLAVEIDPSQYLPADIAVEGFSNIAAALTVSPAFLEQYLNAARIVARMAVGKPVPELVKASFPPPLPATRMAMWTACRSVRGAARGSSTLSRRTGNTASRSLTSISGSTHAGSRTRQTWSC